MRSSSFSTSPIAVLDQPRGVRMHAVQIVYRVRVVGGELRDEIDGSTDTCAWFTVADARGLRLGQLARRVIEDDEAGRLGVAALSRGSA